VSQQGAFTGCLLLFLTQAGLTLAQVFAKASDALLAKMSHTQMPWIYSSGTIAELVLKPAAAEGTPGAAAAAAAGHSPATAAVTGILFPSPARS